MRRALALVALAGLVVAGCASDDGGDDGQAADPTTSPSTTPPTTAVPECRHADAERRSSWDVTVAGEERTYLVDVPASYDGESPAALILNWHGNGSTADQQAIYSGLAQATDALVVVPEGTGEPRHFSLVPGPENPDIAFALRIVEEVSRDFCVDPDRVFTTGISNGAGLSSEIACHSGDVFAAVALVAATIGPLGCDPSTRIPVLAFHGTADATVPYDGGTLGDTALQLPPAEDGIRGWAAQNGCDEEPSEEQVAEDVLHWTFTGCDADVEFYRVEGAGHVWPGAVTGAALEARLGPNTTSIDASAVISEWFESHPREG